MRWLIVEDALRDYKGHWFEYVRTFRTGLLALGDEVTILADRQVSPEISKELEAKAVLPSSIWHRMGDGAGALRRTFRIPWHGLRTWHCVHRHLKDKPYYDVIFVPTVSVHHLVGWVPLIRSLRRRRTKVLLYFLSIPLRFTVAGAAEWISSPTTRLLKSQFEALRPFIAAGRVVIGVETQPLRDALGTVTGLPVRYMPQPVEAFALMTQARGRPRLMACYGAARAEKGSDILQQAIRQWLQQVPDSTTCFALQWGDDFRNAEGKLVVRDDTLCASGRVEFINRYLANGEYAHRLAKSDVILLPYRWTSYNLRGSRVLLEALIHGIPVVATHGTALSAQAEEFGAAALCQDGNVASLTEAIGTMEQNLATFQEKARARMLMAREHFSVSEFRTRLLSEKAMCA